MEGIEKDYLDDKRWTLTRYLKPWCGKCVIAK